MPKAYHPLVATCSLNPAKTKGVRSVFSHFFPGSKFTEVDPSPMARGQPIGLAQVLEGASRRARFALAKANADFGVGVEAGLLRIAPRTHINLQIAFIVDKDGRSGVGLSSGFQIPETLVTKMKREGLELDQYVRELVSVEKVEKEKGIVYHLTHGGTSRLQMTEQSVSMALVPWLNKGSYH